MEKDLLRYIELLIRIIESVRDSSELKESESEELNKISKKLIEFLITNPGGLIFIENKEKINALKFAVKKLFELYPPDEIYEEILEGGFGGLMFDELDAYAYRVKKLMPTFLSKRPENDEFFVYYNEAMRCWLYGLNNSSIIIVTSLLENILKDMLKNFSQKELLKIIEIIRADEEYRRVQINFENLIDIAEYKGILSNKSKNSSHDLRKIRNKIVHKGYNIDSDKSLELLTNTKEILEELFN